MKIIFVLFLLMFGCFLITQNSTDITDLNELKSIVREYAVSQNEKFISIHISSAQDVSLKNKDKERIYNMMDENNIYEINYSNEKNESVSFMLDSFFGNNKFYIYSSNGYTEALQVNSVRDFIDEFRLNQRDEYFSVCEKLERKNWFYCENNH